MKSADSDLNRLRFEMQSRDVNTNAVTKRLNNFNIRKNGIQNLFEKFFSDIDVLNINFASEKFAVHVLAAEVFKQHR